MSAPPPIAIGTGSTLLAATAVVPSRAVACQAGAGGGSGSAARAGRRQPAPASTRPMAAPKVARAPLVMKLEEPPDAHHRDVRRGDEPGRKVQTRRGPRRGGRARWF